VVSALEKTRIVRTRNWKEQKKVSLNELVVILSNYHFVRDRQEAQSFEKCQPHHCTVALKFSSSDFASSRKTNTDEEERFSFDKHGTIFPLSCFISLLNSTDFVEYVQKAHLKYKTTIKKKNSSTSSEASYDQEFEVESEDGRISYPFQAANLVEPVEEEDDHAEISFRKRSGALGKKTLDPKKIKKSKS